MDRLRVELDAVHRLDIEILALERRLESLRQAKALIEELRASPLPSLTDDLPVMMRVKDLPESVFRSLSDPSMTITDAARVILSESRKPLPVPEITERMVRAGFNYPAGTEKLRASLRALLSRKVAEGDTFVSVGRGLFGLVMWEVSRRFEVPIRSNRESADGAAEISEGSELQVA